MDLRDVFPRLYFGDIVPFMQKSGNGYFATICSGRDAELKTVRCTDSGTRIPSSANNPDVFICFRQYDDAETASILEQASAWRIMVRNIEVEYPPESYMGGPERSESTHYSEVEPSMVLVENGNFAGAIMYSSYLSGGYDLFHAPISAYRGQPLLFAISESSFSEGDIQYELKRYLVNLADIDPE